MSFVLANLEEPQVAAKQQRRCQHCGNQFEPRFEAETFCCAGCRVVHDMIETGGFGTFYELLGKKTLQPAESAAARNALDERVAEAIAEAERECPEESPAKLTLRVGNLSCTACVWLIERLHRNCDGALKILTDTQRSIVTLWWTPGEFDVNGFIAQLHRFGYPASVVDENDEDLPSESQGLLTRLGVTAGLAMNTMVFTLPAYLGLEPGDELARLFSLVAFASSTLALAVGGSYFFQRAWTAFKANSMHMDIPISLGLAAAYAGSLIGMIFDIEGMLYFDFVATFAFLMLGGRWLHLRIVEQNRRQLRARERDLTTVFRIENNGAKQRVGLRKVEAWDVLEIPPGAIVPARAQLLDGAASFQLDWINGEPEPVSFEVGQEIPAGARNGAVEAVRLISREAFVGSTLERLLFDSPSAEAREFADPLVEKILRSYLFAVLGIAVVGGTTWFVSSQSLPSALQVFISVLVVSCPCALGLALPLLDEILLTKLKRDGIFLRRHSLWGRLRKITKLVFDKTGTLTEPAKRLLNPDVLDRLEENECEALRALTIDNSHPIAKALNETLTSRFGVELKRLDGNRLEVPGMGVSIVRGESTWRLGRGSWATHPDDPDHGEACVLSCDQTSVAVFRIEETIRDGADDQLRDLRGLGYRLALLSGDPDGDRVARTARLLGLEPKDTHYNVTPEEKADYIQAEPEGSVLFIGDGGNDSLAFRAAAASGAPATGISAVEGKADFIFSGRGFHAIGQLLATARRRRHLIAAIFATAIVYNVLAVAVCLAGYMNPLLAAILMPLSSIVTTAIATRGSASNTSTAPSPSTLRSEVS